MRFTRHEVLGVLATRHGQTEGQGDRAWLEFKFRITPEALERIMASEILWPGGTRSHIESIEIDGDGIATPIIVPAIPTE